VVVARDVSRLGNTESPSEETDAKQEAQTDLGLERDLELVDEGDWKQSQEDVKVNGDSYRRALAGRLAIKRSIFRLTTLEETDRIAGFCGNAMSFALCLKLLLPSRFHGCAPKKGYQRTNNADTELDHSVDVEHNQSPFACCSKKPRDEQSNSGLSQSLSQYAEDLIQENDLDNVGDPFWWNVGDVSPAPDVCGVGRNEYSGKIEKP